MERFSLKQNPYSWESNKKDILVLFKKHRTFQRGIGFFKQIAKDEQREKRSKRKRTRQTTPPLQSIRNTIRQLSR